MAVASGMRFSGTAELQGATPINSARIAQKNPRLSREYQPARGGLTALDEVQGLGI